MKRLLLAALLTAMALPAGATNLVKSYSYFTIGGTTLDEIQDQLASRGPKVKSTGLRHPGATQMQFTTKLGFTEKPGSCQISSAVVTVKVKVILPKWAQRRHADPDVRFFWDTLASDIKRHEEAHVDIAKRHGRMLEDALKASGRQKSCDAARQRAKEITARILTKHDSAQLQFDRAEAVNFESRILRLLKYRMEQAEAARKPS